MCTPESNSNNTTVILRNGLDYIPKKTYPPNYSNVPDIRSWQMSPFSKERFDLNEIQIAEKKGLKGRAELEALKKKYTAQPEKKLKISIPPKCPKCAEREEDELRFGDLTTRGASGYIPYGPTPRVQRTKTRMDRHHFSHSFAGFGGIKTKGFESFKIRGPTCYIPYGPTPKKFSTCGYEPMGPTLRL